MWCGYIRDSPTHSFPRKDIFPKEVDRGKASWYIQLTLQLFRKTIMLCVCVCVCVCVYLGKERLRHRLRKCLESKWDKILVGDSEYTCILCTSFIVLTLL